MFGASSGSSTLKVRMVGCFVRTVSSPIGQRGPGRSRFGGSGGVQPRRRHCDRKPAEVRGLELPASRGEGEAHRQRPTGGKDGARRDHRLGAHGGDPATTQNGAPLGVRQSRTAPGIPPSASIDRRLTLPTRCQRAKLGSFGRGASERRRAARRVAGGDDPVECVERGGVDRVEVERIAVGPGLLGTDREFLRSRPPAPRGTPRTPIR